ncbi:right-handed parallel beta-helix repeat-containing protein, partial [bacterium]|nr:right-handed parallel beta-helix repeat-containing protein [bacterium]
LLLLLLLLLLAGIGSVDAKTHRVPSEYPTIQAGLNSASLGDTVLVAPGVYSDWTILDGLYAVVAIVPDGVVVKSEAGPSATVIDLAPLAGVATTSEGFVMMGHASGETVVSGFRITGFPPWSAGAGASYSARVQVRDCVFESDVPADPQVYRKGIGSRLAEVEVSNCTFRRCSATDGSAIGQTGGILLVDSCEFIECSNSAIRLTDATGGSIHRLEVRNSLFRDCVSSDRTAGISAGGVMDAAIIDNCRFENMTMSISGTVTLGGTFAKTVTNCVFYDIEMAFGAGSCLNVGGAGLTRIAGNTFAFTTQPVGNGSVMTAGFFTDLIFENNIVAHADGVAAVNLLEAGTFTSNCNVFWGNTGGIGYEISPTDRIVDPQFCDPEARVLTLMPTSPCLPSLSLGCGLIGALDEGCSTIAVEERSWAKVKAAYRDDASNPERKE